ncbi:hypothetical protein MY8738_010190 [Beauveria namnaoensis]
MTFSNTPRVFLLSFLALSAAGQWTGNYNTTAVPLGQDPAEHCWIQSLAQEPYTVIQPCVCTGGKVTADCNWKDLFLNNRVWDATCVCEDYGALSYPKAIRAYRKRTPDGVSDCMCDPAIPKGEPDADGLIVPSGNCWCSASQLKLHSGLTEAKEVQADPETPAPETPAPETPAPVDAAAVQECPDDF